jgi:hypothetical protein
MVYWGILKFNINVWESAEWLRILVPSVTGVFVFVFVEAALEIVCYAGIEDNIIVV